MWKFLTNILAALWSLRLFLNLFAYTHLWWVKEYRWDRMRIHLHTEQGKRILFPALRRPPVSPKSIVLIVSGLIVSGVLIFFLPYHLIIRFFVADILLFPITAILVGLLNLPTKIYHEIRIFLAVSKLRNHKPMTVIGITGSFGKTSTKEYIATILRSKFKVLKTEASKNSPIGIAETVLEELKPEHEVFVVEMGAYKRGEIAKMASMVKPEIGIVTAVNAQHQDLFGTIENTIKSKYELIQGLVGKKIAIFNGDNKYTLKMAKWTPQSLLYSKEKTTNIKSSLDGIEFTYAKIRVKLKVLGEHQIGNILAALIASKAVGMALNEAAKAASQIKPFPKTLEPVAGINGSLFINDTFNNNPDAAKAALAVLKMAKGRKIMVLQPMIELGSYTESSHKEVGAQSAKVCDDIILTNKNFLEFFLDGVRSVNSRKAVMVLQPKQASDYIRKVVKKGDVVLFKGKEAEQVLRFL